MATEKNTPAKINLPTGVRHAQSNVTKFRYRGRTIDLRTISEARAIALAKDQNCKVLEQTNQAKKAEGDSKK